MMVEVNVSMASVTVRVDADTKQKAANIAEDLGLDLSSVTRAFYKQIVRGEAHSPKPFLYDRAA